MTAANRLEQAIAGLRDRFLLGLPARLDVIDTALLAAATSDVERGFHSLAGTAGTYGLPAIAEVAAEGEYACTSDLDENTPRRLAVLLDRLRLMSQARPRGNVAVDDSRQENEWTT